MKEEDIIKQKIDSLNDFDLSFNTSKGWKELSQKRKRSEKRFWPVLSRVAAIVIVGSALWLLVSKLTYFRKIDVSTNKPGSFKQIEPIKNNITAHVKSEPGRTETRVIKHKSAGLKIQDEIQRTVFEVEPISYTFLDTELIITTLKPDSIKNPVIKEPEKTADIKVVHINEINRAYVHPFSKKQRTFYVKIGSESVEIADDQKAKTLSYIIR